MIKIENTIELIKEEHLSQNIDVPYYWHLVRVMLRTNQDNYLSKLSHVCLLHDILEDTRIKVNDLVSLGYDEEIIDAVKWCSRTEFPNSTFKSWMKEIGLNAPELSLKTKYSDISDNKSFERSLGLILKNKISLVNKNYSSKINPNTPLQSLINKKTNKSMTQKSDVNIYYRYYDGWNLMYNEKNAHLIDSINTGDFVLLDDLLSLNKFITKSDFNSYFSLNNLKKWQINGKLQIINDRVGNPYLAIHVNNNIGVLYQNFLKEHISEDFILNQQNRDSQSYHITVVNSMDFKKLEKEIFTNYHNIINKNFNFWVNGIGSVIDNNKQAWFVILENPSLKIFRNNLNLPEQHYHMTLAFKNSDVFTRPKNITSLVFNNEKVWEYFSNHPELLKNFNKNTKFNNKLNF